MSSKKIIKSMRSWTDEQLIEAIKTSRQMTEVGRKLGLTTYGANSKTIKKRIAHLKLDISHFMSADEQRRIARGCIKTMTHEDLFSVNSVGRQHIKRIIIRNQLIPYECAHCHIITWQDKLLSLHLDHINGISNDNRLVNLRFLCPNCHSQTDTYCGKQLKNKQYVNPRCCDCNVSIGSDSVRCKSCAAKTRKNFGNQYITKINWLDTSILKQMVEEFGYAETGRRLGVSDNAVKKRIRNYPI